jgi:hypothetical protein
MFIDVADMIRALSALPANARIAVTETGYYSYDPYAEVMLPEFVENDNDGVPIYRVGHSHQSY